MAREFHIADLFKDANLISYASEAFRMIKQGEAKIDCKKISDKDFKPGLEMSVYKVGKRKFELVTI